MHNMILIRLRADCYTADFAKDSQGQRILELFGTTEIPTPYTPHATVDQVIRGVQANNPQCLVVFVPDNRLR
jgi:hypothetical protein